MISVLYDTENLGYLTSLVREALPKWGYDSTSEILLLNYSENATFRLILSTENDKIIRVHRQGYQQRLGIESELTWMLILREKTSIKTPKTVTGLDGKVVQQMCLTGHLPHFLVMTDFIEGSIPDESQDLSTLYFSLGFMAAQCHEMVRNWDIPKPFYRFRWDDRAVFGRKPSWGHWREGPKVNKAIVQILEDTQKKICHQLAHYGQERQRFGLIHADMRLANLLLNDNDTYLIDFDDCGFGWYMYDFATTISFIEDHTKISEWKQHWLEGYQGVATLTKADHAMMDSLVMLRRLNLLGWMGTHPEVEIVQELSNEFAQVSASLAEKYLSDTPLY